MGFHPGTISILLCNAKRISSDLRPYIANVSKTVTGGCGIPSLDGFYFIMQ